MIVWMSILRKGLNYHYVSEEFERRKTVCGRYIGLVVDGELMPVRGHLLPVIAAVDMYAARVCRSCAGTAEKVEPRAVPSRDRVA